MPFAFLVAVFIVAAVQVARTETLSGVTKLVWIAALSPTRRGQSPVGVPTLLDEPHRGADGRPARRPPERPAVGVQRGGRDAGDTPDRERLCRPGSGRPRDDHEPSRHLPAPAPGPARPLARCVRRLVAHPGSHRGNASRRHVGPGPDANDDRARRVGGVALPEGARLALLFASANHDEAYFPDAATFDIHRQRAKPHLAFGQGIHHCVGAQLARLEGRVALELLSARLSRPPANRRPGAHVGREPRPSRPPGTSHRVGRLIPQSGR